MKFMPAGGLSLLLFAIAGEAADLHSTTDTDNITPVSPPLTRISSSLASHSTVEMKLSSQISAVASACAAEPIRGKVYYYCDCGTGAETGCVPGNDNNAGTNPATPRQTIENAATRFNSLPVNDTVALCKGGAFNSKGNLEIGSNKCNPGVTCNDLREYTPATFTGTSKPIINHTTSDKPLFRFMGATGGVRFLNLKLKGNGGTNGNHGFFFYDGAHDVTMCNLDMDSFSIAVYNESGHGANEAMTANIKLRGSLITNSKGMGYLGGGMNNDISYNHWDGNGSSTVGEHTIYLSSVKQLTNVRLIGNYVRGQHGLTCLGAPVVAHMAVDGLEVKDNVVEIAASASTGGCWGIVFNNFTNDPAPIYHRNAIFSGNTIKNGGNLALTVTGCPDCVIENNLIIYETAMEARGIKVASGPVRTGIADEINTRNMIRNNTIWYSPQASGGGTGIEVGIEGAGHVIANNTVTYSGPTTDGKSPFNCFKYPLTLESYKFINNNHCYSAATSNWVEGHGDLASWRAYSSTHGFDTASFAGRPLFKAAGTNFRPASGSPLIGVGNTLQGSVFDILGKARQSPPTLGAYER